MPDRDVTLVALLAIKSRKEQRIRQKMSHLEEQQNKLKTEKLAIEEDRQHLLAEWREYSSTTQTLSPQEWRQYRMRISRYYQHEQFLTGSGVEIEGRLSQLQAEWDNQSEQLRLIRIRQEKITLMME